ncbi:carboxypeptidase-like regulatory domain-containing protein [Bythopirellula goksoeyrii]|uniref:Nickel uptake substrate-specific transmembrane region n=1 Tax=Bythopirellula goksoeyrii TaxID=1400387 RepID=A0A5B9QES6_9BACT|nr:carboxypeptidase-like regulatory domain-containing protein [Bythopirellula goksoeyrii]QEG36002.1 hypothetical protein Pr1d_33110 [Bythopirellula goksoeyrii]
MMLPSGIKSFQRKVTWAAGIMLVAQPQLILAAESAAANSHKSVVISHDVALADGGIVTGQVVDTAGQPQANMPVSLHTNHREIARVQTDEQGNFRVARLEGGVYRVGTTGSDGVYRFWSPQTAPPSAQPGLNLVSGNQVVRGQSNSSPMCSMGQWIAEHPVITIAGVAAAIAIPLALNDDDDPPATP